MFRFESLPEEWIKSCTSYIQSIFGDMVKDKVVVDYAFGRGNWSLAFIAAGASKVVAIDASSDNVARFRAYCEAHGHSNIEVIQGNLLERELNVRADFFWVYGILQHLPDVDRFLERLKTLANPQSLFYFYFYNGGSLREFTVDTCRRLLVYDSEAAFLADSPLFVRSARMRARDDLVTPHVDFLKGTEFQLLLRRNGFYPIRQDSDFSEFLRNKPTQDFYPHQVLATLDPTGEVALNDDRTRFTEESAVLAQIADSVLKMIESPEARRKIAIGLFNTHFAYSGDGCDAGTAVVELFLYLINLHLHEEGEIDSSPTVQAYSALTLASIAGEERSEYSRLAGDNYITRYLIANRVRL
jgi:SAM-dependent methyltransferase